MPAKLAVGVLASGEGTTFGALAERVADGRLPIRLAVLLVDRPGAPVAERARRCGVPVVVVPARGPGSSDWAARATGALEHHGVELVVLAGFLSILPAEWVRRWHGRAINLHPSLLPRYGGPGMFGLKVHRAVLDAHEAETGATVHLVTDAVDGGPTIAQRRLAVRPDDTPERLRARLHPIEVELLAETIGRFASGALPLPYLERGDDRAATSGGRSG